MAFRKRPVIMWSMSRWDGDLSSASWSIAKELAKSNPVFYIDYPYTFLDYLREKNDPPLQHRKKALLQGKEIYTELSAEGEGSLTAVVPPLMLPFYFLKEGFLANQIIRINNRRFMSLIERIVRDHKLKDYILYNSFNPFYGYELSSSLKPDFFLYQCRDNLRGIEIMRPAVPYEQQVVRNADLTIATSSYLVQILEEETGKKVQLMPNAAEVPLFQKAQLEELPVPEELREEQRKVVGYLGNIGVRMDFDLLNKITSEHPDKLFLMIGPEQKHEYRSTEWAEHDNVVFTGARRLEDLPAYLQHIDCSIIPFAKDELTAGIYPLKLNEHLAAGVPVITTDFSEDVKLFTDVTYVAKTHQEFSAMIDMAIQENCPEKIQQRMDRSKNNSWADRIEFLDEILQSQLADSLS